MGCGQGELKNGKRTHMLSEINRWNLREKLDIVIANLCTGDRFDIRKGILIITCFKLTRAFS